MIDIDIGIDKIFDGETPQLKQILLKHPSGLVSGYFESATWRFKQFPTCGDADKFV
jgi:hypothetical protein